jgi:hypothetical protein
VTVLTIEITHSTIVLVEGPDEVKFLPQICRARGIADVQYLSYDGKTNLLTTLRNVVRLPGFRKKVTSLGIIRDADTDRRGAIQSVRDAFRDVGLQAAPTELTVGSGRPRTAFFIVPGGGNNGELEDCILNSVAGHAALPCIDDLLTCVQIRTGADIAKKSKARVRALLAVRPEEPLNMISEGARVGLFPPNHAAFNDLAALVAMLA